MGNGGPFKMFHVKHLSELIESYFSKMLFSIKSLKSLTILSIVFYFPGPHGLISEENVYVEFALANKRVPKDSKKSLLGLIVNVRTQCHPRSGKRAYL